MSDFGEGRPSLDIAFGGFKEPVSSETDNVVNYALTRAGEEWHVNVQTPAAWAGSTVAFRVLLADGTVHSARFTFR